MKRIAFGFVDGGVCEDEMDIMPGTSGHEKKQMRESFGAKSPSIVPEC